MIEGHRESEDGRGHEEVYIVVRGRATVTLEDETLDAPAGTLVCVRDPRIYRRAVAAESNTVVIALGGEPVFEASPSEWIERARPYLSSDLPRAREILAELHRRQPDSPGDRVGQALLLVAEGDETSAAQILRDLLAETPEARQALASDPTLADLVPAKDRPKQSQ